MTAYRKTKASKKRYPNSAELLRVAICEGKLSGGITETCPEKHKKLAECWKDSDVATRCASWREEIERGVLACQEDLGTPWLFSMDPMTYAEASWEDDVNLHWSDLCRIGPALRLYFGSGQPGVAAIFVYNVRPKGENSQQQFWNFMAVLWRGVAKKLPENVDIALSCYSLPHRREKRNLAGLIHSRVELSSDMISVDRKAPAHTARTH